MPPPNPKPTEFPEWASGPDAAISEPLAGEATVGWVPGQPPQASYWNKVARLTWQWILYLDTIIDDLRTKVVTWTGRQTFSAGADIDSGATVDGGLAVTGGATVSGAVVVSSGGATVAGGVVVSSGGVAATGNSTIQGTLGVTGNTTVGGTLGVTGNTTVGGTLGVTNVLTALKGIISDWAGTEAFPGFFYKATTATRALAAKWTITSGMACRFFVVSPGKFLITINASWNGSAWVADTAATASLWLGLSASGFELKSYTAPDATPFADAAFTNSVSFAATGTKGQVLGFTADNTAVMSNTMRYAELGIALEGAFASSTGPATLYRDITGHAGISGFITLPSGALASVVATTPYQVLTLASSGPNTIYQPDANLIGCKYPIVLNNGVSHFVAYFYFTSLTTANVIGLQPNSGTWQVSFPRLSWRTQ